MKRFLTWKTGTLVLIGLILVLITVDLVVNAHFVRAYLTQPENFTASTSTPSLYFQPEMSSLASELDAQYSDAVETVEAAYGLHFVSVPRVYLCGTKRCFEDMTGVANRFIRGAATPRGVVISPDILEWRESTVPILEHELSHLMLKQRLGFFRRPPPAWFNEGFAVLISEGAGAERVSRDEAIDAIRAGHHFEPITRSRLFRPQTARDFGLTTHMFYRQAWLFLEFLEAREPGSVRDIANRTAQGEGFSASFNSIFGAPPDALWEEFEVSLGH